MAPSLEVREVSSLKGFYDLMSEIREWKKQITRDIYSHQGHQSDWTVTLDNALTSLKNIPREDGLYRLQLDATRPIQLDLKYEISELEKDIFFLNHSWRDFLNHLNQIHPNFDVLVDTAVEKLRNKHFNAFITDRDGTTNNYCGRYRSSIQSIYNALFLTEFAARTTTHPIIITSAPLQNTGIVDVSVIPDKTYIYAASKGREYLDLNGTIHRYPIEDKKQRLLDKLNEQLSCLIAEPQFEKFSLIGSGLQFKFGQTTIARQDISNSIHEKDSQDFLQTIKTLVLEVDPSMEHFRIEDTGLDIEIILTIESSSRGLKDFDKSDGVRFLNDAMHLSMQNGPHLICGDTPSDIPMVEAALEISEDTWSIFVTKDPDLAAKVKKICPNGIIVPEPDILVAILYKLSID